ncbi:MAG: hypothetical protein LBP68_08620 [Acidobacteriota bacterium]|jgi:hypothetical protein|nr:hypothetical protein [Acidobacteriota bacterium]
MIGRKSIATLILLVIAAVQTASAQTAPAAPAAPAGKEPPTGRQEAKASVQGSSFYRLDFVIREMDGQKVVDSQRNSLLVESSKSAKIVSGAETPYSTKRIRRQLGLPDVASDTDNIGYRNTGVQINCTVRNVTGASAVQLDAHLEISSILPQEGDLIVFRKISTDMNTFLELDKLTTVSIAADSSSRNYYYVDVTATKIKDVVSIQERIHATGSTTDVGLCVKDEKVYSPGAVIARDESGQGFLRCSESGNWVWTLKSQDSEPSAKRK